MQTKDQNKNNPSGTTDHDYSAYLDKEQSKSQLERLSVLADAQRRLEHEVMLAELALAAKKVELKVMSETTLPTLMDELDMEEFRTRSGLTIKLDEHLFASISKDNQDKAFAWLDKHGFSKLIKRAFVVEFGKGEEKWADKFALDLAKRKKPVNVETKKGVHPQTLKAFVKEQLEKGEDIPTELFGVHRQPYTKVELPSDKKKQ